MNKLIDELVKSMLRFVVMLVLAAGALHLKLTTEVQL